MSNIMQSYNRIFDMAAVVVPLPCSIV